MIDRFYEPATPKGDIFVPTKSKHANKGKHSEDAVRGALGVWAAIDQSREFNRLPDTKAAGRIIKAAVADFDWFAAGAFGLIEVKETEHEYRLRRDLLTQWSRLIHRDRCGGQCFVLVRHARTKLWRSVPVAALKEFGDKGSWNLSEWPTYTSAKAALEGVAPTIFDFRRKG